MSQIFRGRGRGRARVMRQHGDEDAARRPGSDRRQVCLEPVESADRTEVGSDEFVYENQPRYLHSREHGPFDQRRSARHAAHGRDGRKSRGRRHYDAAAQQFARNSREKDFKPNHGNRVHRGGPQNRGRCKYLTQRDIEDLTKSDSTEVIHYITENEGGFLAAYSHQPNCGHRLTLKRLLKFLYLLVMSEDANLAARIIAQIFDGSNHDTSVFRAYFDMLIKEMPAETRHSIIAENLQYLKYAIQIGMFAITSVPRSVMHTFPNIPINDTVQDLSQLHREYETLLDKAQTLADEFSTAKSLISAQQDAAVSQSFDSTPPPQHLTELSVLPSTDEIHPHAPKPYLRPNIIVGAYTDWEHYLDVQFRLLREDFVAPLRDGIRTYELKGNASRHLSEVHVYEGVRVCSTVCLLSGVGFHICFDVTRFQRVNWEHSKATDFWVTLMPVM